ncbi:MULTISPECIES: sortase domain-containing protein [unclassified Nocardioides]|uniref:sortase domain-containing protein n=1 Tax=unclassified Nocardioides TaxID=2615069 RepID=UPI0006F27C4B|nr:MULTISPECIES: sortase [unclassified Nocardioides]KRA30936.1 hypothetical protein ASD81_15660 [Nocardioides sp. Root614]KRA87557.1 hypothetical protein ASD84_15935 [Nocardioides sp. Root682]
MGIKARLTRIVAVIGMLAGLAAGTFGIVELTQPEPVTAPPTTAVFADNAPAPVVPAAPEPAVRVAVPTRLEVPAIGVDEKLSGRGLKADGSLDTPDFGKAGWYRPGPRPGEPGGAVVVAHVHGPDGPDVFWDLAKLQPGDEIRIHRADGVATFVVDDVDDVPKEHLPYDRIWPDTDEPLLRLITCGGKRTAAGYPDNTVVYAHLASTKPVS